MGAWKACIGVWGERTMLLQYSVKAVREVVEDWGSGGITTQKKRHRNLDVPRSTIPMVINSEKYQHVII
jgi:hypothetical protein